MNKKPFLSTAEAAEQKGCTQNTILRSIKSGKLNGFQLGGRWTVAMDYKYDIWEVDFKRQSKNGIPNSGPPTTTVGVFTSSSHKYDIKIRPKAKKGSDMSLLAEILKKTLSTAQIASLVKKLNPLQREEVS